MAFSIPIVKKDYDIYNSNKHRQRRLSDCSNAKSQGQSTARHKTSVGGSTHKPVSKSVGHSANATPIGSSHVTTPTRRYSTSRPPSCSSSNSNSATSKYADPNLQKSKSLHTVNHHGAGSSLGAAGKDTAQSSNSLARFHTKLVDRLKSSITCSSSKKSPSPGSSKSTGHLDSKRAS